VQACIWPSGFHCHSLSLAPVKSRLVLPFWYRLTRVVPDKKPLNGCVYVCVCVWSGNWFACVLCSSSCRTLSSTEWHAREPNNYVDRRRKNNKIDCHGNIPRGIEKLTSTTTITHLQGCNVTTDRVLFHAHTTHSVTEVSLSRGLVSGIAYQDTYATRISPTAASGVNSRHIGFLAIGAQCDILLNCAL